jgi:hypothetical protein
MKYPILTTLLFVLTFSSIKCENSYDGIGEYFAGFLIGIQEDAYQTSKCPAAAAKLDTLIKNGEAILSQVYQEKVISINDLVNKTSTIMAVYSEINTNCYLT